MLKHKSGGYLCTFAVVLAGFVFAPFAMADDVDDVMAVIQQYGELENDLDAQSALIRSDRIFINAGRRQTDQERNMATQKANRQAGETAAGGKATWVTNIEGPMVRVYGDTAVASFVRWFNIYPHNQASVTTPSQWVTLVLVKDGRDWRIAHTHQSAIGGN